MTSKIIASAAGAACLLALAACDTTYTPGAHHFAGDASTGSHLSDTDTGVGANTGLDTPSLTTNGHGTGGH